LGIRIYCPTVSMFSLVQSGKMCKQHQRLSSKDFDRARRFSENQEALDCPIVSMFSLVHSGKCASSTKDCRKKTSLELRQFSEKQEALDFSKKNSLAPDGKFLRTKKRTNFGHHR
jgi:hypothetical protein